VELYSADLSVERIPSAATDAIDAVVHLAALLVVGERMPEDVYNLNTLGVLRVLEPFIDRGAVPRIVFASTDGAYGNVGLEDVVFSEDAPLKACDYYSNSKVLAEHLLSSFACQYGLPYVILRFATVLARGAATDFFRFASQKRRLRQVEAGRRSNLWPLFEDAADMHALLAVNNEELNPPVALLGPGGKPWKLPLVDVRDVVQAVSLALEAEPCPDTVFNVSGPRTVDQVEAVRMLARRVAVEGHVVHVPRGWRYDLDISKARQMLCYKPQWSFEAMLEDHEWEAV
jgi:UDP-glucose 4-epimerase